MVKSLSAAGKAALTMTKDTEYMKIVGKGYEEPSYSSSVINKMPVGVTTPNKVLSYNWSGANKDAGFWQNVEYNRYGYEPDQQFLTPAKFTVDEFGSAKVHAPQDSGLEIITKVPQIQAINFLDLEDKDTLSEKDETNKESVFNNFLEFPY